MQWLNNSSNDLNVRPVEPRHGTEQSTTLFLDFDGVIHPNVRRTPDEQCLRALEAVVEEFPELKIVISSTWRETYGLKELSMFLGPILGDRVIGVTPVIDDPFLHHVRYHEVLSYLEANMLQHSPWIAIDDTAGFYPSNAPVVWTNPKNGFTPEDGKILRAMLLS